MSDGTQIFDMPYGKFLAIRLEFVLLRDDELEAKIMRIFECWMIDQKKVWENQVVEAVSKGEPEPPEPEYWCTLSYAQIIAQLYKFNSSRGGTKNKPNGKEVIEGKKNSITRVTLANAIHALINDNYLLVRANPNPDKEYEASQYMLNIPLIQEHLMHLPKKPLSYLGNNGRINGIPCENFLRPPEEIKNELGFTSKTDSSDVSTDPRKNFSYPTQTALTSHMKNPSVGDVKNSNNLIDYSNRKEIIDSQIHTGEEEPTGTFSSEEHNSSPPSEMNQEKKLMEEYIKNISQLRRETFPYPVPDAATPKEGTPGYATCLEIADLALSLEELRPVYDALYNEQDKNGEYWRQGNPDRMGPVAFSKQYHRVKATLPAGLFTSTQINQNAPTSPQDEAEMPVVEPEQQFIDEQYIPRVMPRGLTRKIEKLAFVKDFDVEEVLRVGNDYYDDALTWGVTTEQFERIVLLLIEECQPLYLSDIREYGCERFERYFCSRLGYELTQVTPYKEETQERMQA